MPRKKAPEASPEEGRILERPDGFYWEVPATKQLRGPFESRAEAEEDRLAGGAGDGDGDPDAADTLQEAESEVGIADWIDPDTGGPAEDNVPHIEDH